MHPDEMFKRIAIDYPIPSFVLLRSRGREKLVVLDGPDPLPVTYSRPYETGKILSSAIASG